jgi:hypothetical protein
MMTQPPTTSFIKVLGCTVSLLHSIVYELGPMIIGPGPEGLRAPCYRYSGVGAATPAPFAFADTDTPAYDVGQRSRNAQMGGAAAPPETMDLSTTPARAYAAGGRCDSKVLPTRPYPLVGGHRHSPGAAVAAIHE